MTIEIV